MFRIHNDGFDWDKFRELTGGKVLLGFSCGKDSLATWLTLRDQKFEVVPHYLQLVPGLEFIERSLRYYERFFGVKIYRVLHQNFNRRLAFGHYQPPDRVSLWRDVQPPLYDYDDVLDGMARTLDCPDPWKCIGTRKAESVLRKRYMKEDGINPRTRIGTPIMDWRKDDVLGVIKANGCLLPVDYEMFGRSFDGLYARYLIPIRDRFPADYQRILNWFPLAEAEVVRYELGVKHGSL